jgi:hypothetical protein
MSLMVVVHNKPIQKNTVNLEKDRTLMWPMILYVQLMYPILRIQNKLRREGLERGTKEQVLCLIQTRVQVM